MLLNQNREDEAIDVLEEYQEETASWLYSKALIMFRKHGKGSKVAQAAIKEALGFNPYVVELLSSDSPPMSPQSYQLQSPEEAENVLHEQMDIWIETDGFLDWMFDQHIVLEQKRQKRSRDLLQAKRQAAKKRKKKRK